MNSNLLRSVAAMGVAATLFGASGAMASDSRTVTVNATIVGVCKFFTATPVINITNTASGSNIDPSLAGPATGNVPITYRCSNGTPPSFTVPATATVTFAGPPSATMTPTITSANTGNGTGLGSGKDQTLTVTATILQAAYENAPVGAYTGTMTVSVTP